MGKTFAAAVLTEALRADYWKPVQAGLTPTTDAGTVRGLVQNPVSRFWPERHRLALPASPHAAAENLLLCADKNDAIVKISLPENNQTIVASKYQLYLPTAQQLVAEVKWELNKLDSL